MALILSTSLTLHNARKLSPTLENSQSPSTTHSDPGHCGAPAMKGLEGDVAPYHGTQF